MLSYRGMKIAADRLLRTMTDRSVSGHGKQYDIEKSVFVEDVEAKNPISYILWNLMIVAGVLIYGSYTILVHLCEVDGKLPFSSASTVLVTEILKLTISIGMYTYEKQKEPFPIKSWRVVVPFAVPAVLYCMTNNLSIHIQLEMDPATYQVLNNLKILSTALLYRIIMKKHFKPARIYDLGHPLTFEPISYLGWIALTMLATAGAFNGYGGLMSKPENMSASVIHITFLGLGMIGVYTTLSGLAGVYSEYILKGKYEMSIHVQNSMLYVFGVLLNGSIWVFGTLSGGESWNLFQGYSIYTWLVVLSQAVIGLIMSAIMKHASNITRLFLISSAMVVATVLSVLIFHLQLNSYFCVSFVLVFTALILNHKA